MARPTWTTAAIFLGCATGAALTTLLVSGPAQVAQATAADPLPPAPVAEGAACSVDQFAQVVERAGPSVVTVDAVRPPLPASITQAAAPPGRSKPQEESGSGVLVKLPGQAGVFAVTNHHVVGAARPSDVTITLSDGRILRPERVLADPESDIAILQLADANLPTLPFADSDRAKVGQWVLAFGSPFGLQQTVTHGIISARDRGQISLGNTIRIKEFLQSDTPINPGNSGGPMVDLSGRVLGINTAIATNNGVNSGISFSIPANLVIRVGRELLEKGSVSRGYLGLQLAPALEAANALRLGLTRVSGALVEAVHPDGPAQVAGLRPGDVILKLNSVEIRDENHLINLVSALPGQRNVTLTVWRAKQAVSVPVTIGDWAAMVAGRR